jgi:hypothetical protein
MVGNTKVIGSRESKMAKGHTILRLASSEKENGLKESE